MHIEPGVVDGAKMVLSHATAAAAGGYTLKLAVEDIRSHDALSFGLRAALAGILTFFCFEVLPHFPVGVSEVHFILGTTVLLLFGAAPAAVGLAGGLAVQSFFFAPSDIPMLPVNVTTLLFPLFVIHELARRMIPADRAYVDLRYGEILKLSLAYQGGIVAWVAFWAFYGQGFAVAGSVLSFGAAYMLVVLIEPLADLAVLAAAKGMRRFSGTGLFVRRLHHPA